MPSSRSHHGACQGSSRLALLFMLAISTPFSTLQHTSLLKTGGLVGGNSGGSLPYKTIAMISGPQGRVSTLSTIMTSAVCSTATAKWLYSSSWILLSSLPGLMIVESAPVTIPNGGITVAPDPVVVGGVLGGNSGSGSGSGSSSKKPSQAGPSPSSSNSLAPSTAAQSSPSQSPISSPSAASPSSGTNTPNVLPPSSSPPQVSSSPGPNSTNSKAGGSGSGADENCSSAGAVLVSCSFGPDASPSGSSSLPFGADWPPTPSSSMTSSSVNNHDNNNSNDNNAPPQGGVAPGTQTSATAIKAAIISIASIAALGIVIMAILVVRRKKQLKQQHEEEQASFNAYGAYHSGKTRRLKKTDQHVGLNSFCSTDTRSSVPLKPLEQFWNP